MKAIYEPRGAAKEYSPLAANIYAGCMHGCTYCYAPACLHKLPEQFHAGFTLREGFLDALALDAFKLKRSGNQNRILLCFTSDPYQPGDNTPTRRALEVLSAYGRPVAVLTKGGTRAVRDFDLLADMDAQYGTTLLFSEDSDRATWEPNAAPVGDRIEAIMQAHDLQIPTWVSVEPIIDPEQAISLIETLSPWVDEWRIGKLNHHPHAKTVDWKAWAPRLLEAAQESGRDYLIKDALAAFLPVGAERRRPTYTTPA
jgi:DNA repair photolyase